MGWFVEPTIVLTTDPKFVTMEEEIFAPVLTIHVYADEAGGDRAAPGRDLALRPHRRHLRPGPHVIDRLTEALANTAGNFYINDKCTGAMVGHQPFGGARATGTNDKAGSFLNLIRWTSPRTIKECFSPHREWAYPFMEEE